MDEATANRVSALLREGLDEYGVDRVDGAVAAWRRVLELDPGNGDALEYIEAAGRTDGEAADSSAATDAQHALALEALSLLAAGDAAAAYECLRGAVADIASLEVEAAIELTRWHRLASHRETLQATAIPELCAPADQFQDINLPADSGFLLSQIDGQTSIADLISLSGMDQFEALDNLCGLIDAGLVGIRS
jgi:tetratricopeptide (TPR) repeat protein